MQLDAPDPVYDHEKDWCLPEGAARPQLHFLILTVPDPVTTPLALYFDRSIDALEAAGQQYDLYPDHYWLPWPRPGTAGAPGDTAHDARVTEILNAFRSSQPGLIILSGSSDSRACLPVAAEGPPCATFAFLVSESPTSGIDQAQFKNAVKYAKLLSRSGLPDVHVVGPFFSGSAPSAIALYKQLKGEAASIDFVSGTMTGRSQADALRSAGVRFTQTLHDDSTARAFLLSFLRQRGLTQSGGNVAILQEDETVYGNIFSADARAETPRPNIQPEPRHSFSQVRYITYPRELSLLRNAAADTFGVAPLVPGEPTPQPTQSLSWSWKDTSKDEDRMPSFSGSQQPLSQQAVLVSIADALRKENIKYVGITGTDIFDILFLSKFLKSAAPNTRLFMLDADLLMVASGDAGRDLSGTLAVTTYPLLARNGDWTVPGKLAHRPGYQDSIDLFPSRIAEALYNAVLFQLDPQHWPDGREYADPFLTSSPVPNSRPPLWLTMVGRTGFWAVSRQANAGPLEQAAPALGKGVHLSPRLRERLTFDPPDGVTLLLEGILLVWGIFQLTGMHLASRRAYGWLAQFQVVKSTRNGQRRNYYLSCTSLALSAMLILIAATFFSLWTAGSIAFGGFSLLPPPFPSLFPSFYIAVALVGLWLLVNAARIGWRRPPAPHWIQWSPWVLYVGTVLVWLFLNFAPHPDATFFALRAFHLTNGVSPLLPIELLLLIYYVWAWMFIRKVRLADSKHVEVPSLDQLGPGGAGLENCLNELRDATDGLIFNEKIVPWLMFVYVALFLLLLRPWEALHSVEGMVYDAFIVCLVLLNCMLIVLTWARYLYIWGRLSRILRALERTPLRGAFSRLPDAYSWSPLWYENAERRAYIISARSVECLRALAHRQCRGAPTREALESITHAFKKVAQADEGESHTTQRLGTAVSRLQALFLEQADQLITHQLRDRWMSEGGSDSLDRAANTDKSAATTKVDCRWLAEEFVALRYVGLIHYESAQMKNLVVLLGVGFIFALAAVGSYPFLAGRQCAWGLAAVFVIFGGAIVMSFAQMDRDAILSRLSRTDPGKLDWGFFIRAASYGALPLLALLASQFPSIGHALFSWLEPALNALH